MIAYYIFGISVTADFNFIAIGAMMALNENGYDVPEDVSMIDYNDIKYSLMYSPPLITLHLHKATMGNKQKNG